MRHAINDCFLSVAAQIADRVRVAVRAPRAGIAALLLASSFATIALPGAARAQDAQSAQSTESTQTTPTTQGDAALIARGAYLARAGDCVACHTAEGGKPFAGGLPMVSPMGTIWSTNITPSKANGIGNYTEAQFAAALRDGTRADGAQLYPAMPYTSFAKLNDADVHALYTYFMRGVPAVDHAVPRTALPFPFGIRSSLAVWNRLFLDDKPFEPDPSKSVEWNRGAYLVEGLAHCSACHTPRNALMAEQSKAGLSGGVVGSWYAPNITPDATSGIGAWSEADIAAYLKSGVAPNRAQAAGPMAEAVNHSFQHLNDADLHAMAVYLKSVPAIHDPADTRAPDAWGAPIDSPDAVRAEPWPADRNQLNGAQLYDANCASCHQATGQGSADGGLPPLTHNTTLGHTHANDVVMAILQGVSHPRREDGSSDGVDMPAFAAKLTDTQVATLTNYLMSQFGHAGVQVTPDDVAQMRDGHAAAPLVDAAPWALAALAVVVVLVVVVLVARKRRRAARLNTGANKSANTGAN